MSRDCTPNVHHVIHNMADEPEDKQPNGSEENEENGTEEEEVTFVEGQVDVRGIQSNKIRDIC